MVSALSGPPGVVLIEGEAGIGKTRLVYECLDELAVRDRQTVVTACPPLLEPLPLGPVVVGLRARQPVLADLGLSPLAGALRPLFPEWAHDLPPAVEPLGDPTATRQRLLAAVVELLERLGTDVLIVEDAQWADPSTMELLLLMSGQSAPTMSLVATYRPEDVVDAGGRMFALDLQGNRLLRVNKQTAAATRIGSLGFDATGALGIDFDDATGRLLLASLDAESQIGSLYTVSTQTGRATVIDQLGDGSQHAALAIASGAPCVPPTEVPWISLSPAEGTTSPGASDEVTVRLDAANLAVGTHQASVCVGSNDPQQPVIPVPIRLTVVEPGGDITLRGAG